MDNDKKLEITWEEEFDSKFDNIYFGTAWGNTWRREIKDFIRSKFSAPATLTVNQINAIIHTIELKTTTDGLTNFAERSRLRYILAKDIKKALDEANK